jgi:hypothetical protein
MNAKTLRGLQAPLKSLYRDEPEAALVTLKTWGTLDPEGIRCGVETAAGPVSAGLHPATGGDGSAACSGEMLLEALVACAGVTLGAVATAMGADDPGRQGQRRGRPRLPWDARRQQGGPGRFLGDPPPL